MICPRGKRHDRAPFELREGVHIYRYPAPPGAVSLSGYPREYGQMLAWSMALATRLYRRWPFDAIHGCNPPDLFFLVGRAFRPFGVSFVFDQHDVNPEILQAKRAGTRRAATLGAGLPERVVGWAERSSFSLADVVIAPNDSYRRIALGRGGVDPDDVFVVRSAPRLGEFCLDGAPFDRRGHRYLVGYLGVMGKQDGVDLLVRAVASLIAGGVDILLYLAGDGESFAQIEGLVDELGIGQHVLMPGYQTAAEFMPALLDADVCVAPDPPGPFNDVSTMNKVVEYMALGRASVAFPLRENRVSGGEAIAYADDWTWQGLASAIGRLLDDDGGRERLGRAARARFLDSLAWERSEPHLLRAYERLAEKVGEGAASAAEGVDAVPGAGAPADGDDEAEAAG